MKTKLLTFGISTVVITLLLMNVAYASWETLGTGFAVTSNISGPVSPQGTPVTITAGTLDPDVELITIRWYGPDGEVFHEDMPSVYTNGTVGQYADGTTALVKYAQSTYTPNVHGEWNVKVIFHNAKGGSNVADFSLPLDIRQNFPIFVVPETPLGTIGAVAAIALALGLFMVKKKSARR